MSNSSVAQTKVDPRLLPVKNGLIVSCQVPDDTAINTPEFIAAQALTVLQAGAVGIRAQGIKNIEAIAKVTTSPLIGLIKRYDESSAVYITPSVSDVVELENAGATIVAVDATGRPRPGGQTLEDFVTQVRLESKILLLADVDSVESAQQAEALGFDAVATTLSGYTDIPVAGLPNIKLIEEISRKVQIPIIAEGGFSQAHSVAEALSAGALAVCIGTAITNPYLLTKHFLTAIN